MQIEYWTAPMEKQVGARVQTLLEDPMLLSVYQRFGGRPFRRSSVFHGLGKFLVEQNVVGSVCFEIGTWNGLTAAVLSKHFERVVSVDIAHNEMKNEILSHLGVKNVTCLDISDNKEKAQVANNLEFDFAYLDGDHANDTESDWALTKRCGRVLFHEVWPFQAPVFDLVQSMPPDEVTYGGAGLALWRKGSR